MPSPNPSPTYNCRVSSRDQNIDALWLHLQNLVWELKHKHPKHWKRSLTGNCSSIWLIKRAQLQLVDQFSMKRLPSFSSHWFEFNHISKLPTGHLLASSNTPPQAPWLKSLSDAGLTFHSPHNGHWIFHLGNLWFTWTMIGECISVENDRGDVGSLLTTLQAISL